MRHSLIASLMAAVMAVTLGARADAAPPNELLRALSLAPDANSGFAMAQIQTDLAWTGFYTGPTNGRSSSDSRSAISAFQRSIGENASGNLSAQGRDILAQRAEATQRGYRFVNREIQWLGISTDLPLAFFDTPYLIEDNSNPTIQLDAISHASGASLRLWQFDYDGSASPERLMKAYLDNMDDDIEVIAARAFRDSFFIAYVVDEYRVTRIGERQNGAWRMAQFGVNEDSYWSMRPLMARIFRSMDLFAGPGVSDAEREARKERGDFPGSDQFPDWFQSSIGNGSGSLVSRQGHILTNQHVVEGCGRLTVNGNAALLVGSDVRLDLAVIQSASLANRRPIRFRATNPQLGETVAVMGYPIFRISQALNYTTGTVSSAVGISGDRTRVQITAPIQSGNSGGPVLDANGRQVAVVAAKASQSLRQQRNVENVGWVIRGRQAVDFLRHYGVNPIVEDRPLDTQIPDPEQVDSWRSLIMRVECHEF